MQSNCCKYIRIFVSNYNHFYFFGGLYLAHNRKKSLHYYLSTLNSFAQIFSNIHIDVSIQIVDDMNLCGFIIILRHEF